MKITKITDQSRRDFWAEMECEGCSQKELHVSGYDDRNFHDNIIPAMKCKSCGKSRNDMKLISEKTPTKYSEHEVI